MEEEKVPDFPSAPLTESGLWEVHVVFEILSVMLRIAFGSVLLSSDFITIFLLILSLLSTHGEHTPNVSAQKTPHCFSLFNIRII